MMMLSLRRARFAALAVLCLALPAAAQMRGAGETVSSAFGSFHGGWAGALGGAMLKPSGALNLYAFPAPLYNEAAASAPDDIVLRRLAPVVVALERGGVAPEEFQKLSPDERAKKIKAILPESYKLVAGYAETLRGRADAVKNGEESAPLFGEMLAFLMDYPNYMDEATRTNLRNSFQTLRMKRVMVEARAAAKNLNGRAVPEDEATTLFAGRPVASLFADPDGASARLFELKVLSDQITSKASQGGSTPARLAAAARAYSLATTGEPSEAVQKAAVRLLTTAIEIDSRRPDGVLYSVPTIDQLGALAKASPFASVQKSALNNLTDNAISLRKPYGRRLHRSAVETAGSIAAATSSREVKAEAVALLLREFRSSTNVADRQAAAAAMRGIEVVPDLPIAKVPAKSASRQWTAQTVAEGILAAGALSFLYGLFSLHVAIVGVGILIILLGHGIRLAFKLRSPWYRRNS